MDDVPLGEHLLAIIAANDRRYQEQFGASKSAVDAALSAAKEAVAKAELSTERRFEGVNEFREQLADQQQTFLTRREYEQAHGALVERNESLTARIAAMEGTKIGAQNTVAWIAAGFGAMIAVISIVIAIVTRR